MSLLRSIFVVRPAALSSAAVIFLILAISPLALQSSLHSHATAGETSSGRMYFTMCGAIKLSVMRVYAPGEIALHRMLYFVPSTRSTLIRPFTVIFAAP